MKRFYCLALIPFLATGCGHKTVSPVSSPFSMGADLQARGVMTSTDWTRLGHISSGIERRHTVSAQDLLFWITLLHRGPLKDQGLNRLQFETLVMSNMDGRKKLASPQQEELYQAVLPYVSEPDERFPPSDTQGLSPQMRENFLRNAQENAIHLLATSRDPSALPVLARLAKGSKRAAIRLEAQKDHDQLQQVLNSQS